ncbi:MAG: pilus assembly protein [Lachnospiraceae bacterium]|nr:pilus assembly protein [Lachnospiraceae bacterium]MDE6186160.1 pilus assembly protein [Lachnospiraceae bacterium]MDE7285253.1 pilus assembly protein [Lachnospiraceae bacterium]
MRKKWKGSFTVEASFIMPIVLFLYLLIILSALFLYCRCAISQNNFLLAMRAARFTEGKEHYGEVIYGLENDTLWQPKQYVEERIERKRAFYPFFPTEEGECIVSKDCIFVQTRQRGSGKVIKKTSQKWNPVLMIRQWRKEQNA